MYNILMIVTLRYFVAGFFSVFHFCGCVLIECVLSGDLTDYAYEIIIKTYSYINCVCVARLFQSLE